MTTNTKHTLLEVRCWNPAEDETEWIVIEQSKPIVGWPEYIARLPFTHSDQARLFAAAPDLLAAAEAINDMLYYQTTTNNGARIFTCCSCSANRSLEHSESCEVACFESAIAKAKPLKGDA